MKPRPIRMPDELWEALEAEAAEEGLSTAEYVRQILRQRADTQANTQADTQADTAGDVEALEAELAALRERVATLEDSQDRRDGLDEAPAGLSSAESQGSVDDTTPSGSEGELDGVTFPEGVDSGHATAAVFRARHLIQDRGGATKAEIVREVMPEYPLGYDVDAALAKLDAGDRYRGAWWRRVVKPGLEALEDVESPPRGASEWTSSAGEA